MAYQFGTNILILVPHPDDEAVACAATIGRAKAMGATIFAAYLTHGCVARDTLWPWQRGGYETRVKRRRDEAQRAAEALGIVPVFWSDRPARHLWRQLPDVLHEIAALAVNYKIDQLWVPAYEGGNADHDGLNAAGYLLSRSMQVLEFAEYNWNGGVTNSQVFPSPCAATVTIKLTPEERRLKRRCLALYASERRNLSYVGAVRESFRPLAAYDYSKPPHPGLLWYERFQWVPFHHPGIDRTTPDMVSAAIARFLQSVELGL